MAVTMGPISNHMYQGLSSDTKPTGPTVLVNSIFYQTDTGDFYVYNGAVWSITTSTPPMRYF